ncbi:hypothetical protein ACLOCF_12030 [Levilactobacillus brevis]|uniref:hypothetical protein n=1 Tax=Levilactobacillus brevis TaxID=1580 RepID=UPI003EB7054C
MDMHGTKRRIFVASGVLIDDETQRNRTGKMIVRRALPGDCWTTWTKWLGMVQTKN